MKTSEVVSSGKDFTGGFFNAMLEAAIKARDNAYAPYSNYKVGCAVIDEEMRIFSGCNVENVAYTGTHAEDAAIAALKTRGGRRIEAVVCVTENGGASCGNCRQKIWEFCGDDTEVMCYFVDLSRDEVMMATIGRLLPFAFKFDFQANFESKAGESYPDGILNVN